MKNNISKINLLSFLFILIIYFLFIFSNNSFSAWGEPELISKLKE